jgi:hypothetical protein
MHFQYPTTAYRNAFKLPLLAFFVFVFRTSQAQPPVIDYFSPISANAGQELLINGSNFSTSITGNTVYFGAAKATVVMAESTFLKVLVPAGATYAPITVTTNNLTAYSAVPFRLTFLGGAGIITSNSLVPVLTKAASPYPRAILAHDFDGDSKPDIVTGSTNEHKIALFPNNSSLQALSFTDGISFFSGLRPHHLAASDLDGDGRPDIVAVHSASNTVSVYRNTTAPNSFWSFNAGLNFTTGTTPTSLSVGDLDGDGRPDMVVTNHDSNTISIFRNTSSTYDITFSPKVDVVSGDKPYFIAMRDLNGDKKPDLAVANWGANSIAIFRNTSTSGNISFAPAIVYTTGTQVSHIAIGDLGADSRPELVVTNSGSGSVQVFKNNSNSTDFSFTPSILVIPEGSGRKLYSTTIGDINGDRFPDLAVTFDSASAGYIGIYTNTSYSNITFSEPAILPAPTSPSYVQIADFNGDARPDLAVGSAGDDAFAVYHNQKGLPMIINNGPIKAGTGANVYLQGKNLGGCTAVQFGGVPATSFTILTDSTLSAVVGTGASGLITVTTPYGTATREGFIYYSRPDIKSFSPAAAGKGQLVTLKGTGFTDTYTFSFGGVRASYTSRQGDTLIAGSVGNGASGDIIITTPGGADTIPGFVFIAPPVIQSFLPASGDSGTVVTIKGQGFTGATSIKFGGKEARSFNVVSDTLSTAIIGSGFTGAITLTTLGGTASLAKFVYTGPVITSVLPMQAGPGTTLTLKGTNLTGTSIVQFGDYPAASFTVVNDSTLTATIGEEASAPIKVTTPTGIAYANLNFSNTIPFIQHISPLSGPTGTTVTINGKNFDPVAEGNLVYVGATRAAVTAATKQQLTITVPTGATYDPITVTANQRTSSSLQMFNTTFNGTDTLSPNTLAPAQLYESAGPPFSIHLKDMDGDGKADIAMVNTNVVANSISLFRNIGVADTISFADKTTYATAFGPNHLDLGDLDGDGKPDIAVANGYGNSISVFRNTSTPGTFSLAPKTDYPAGLSPYGIAIADINADGKPDIVVANSQTNTISVFKNKSTPGNLSFENKLDIIAGATPYHLSVGDIDGDALPDVVVTNPGTNTITVLRNISVQNSISFSISQFPCGLNPRHVHIADLDNDGKADLAIAPYQAGYAVSILQNTSMPGTISFNTPANFGQFNPDPSTAGPMCVVAGDINGDGKPDLAVANQTRSRLTLLRNTSNGGSLSFNEAEDYTYLVNNPYTVSIGDLNGDDRPDVVLGSFFSRKLHIYKNLSGTAIARLDSFAPTNAASGDTVVIHGKNFTGATEVSFGVKTATAVTVVNDSTVKAVVADMSQSGNISISTPQGIASAAGFIYTGPLITSFTPQVGGKGSPITIKGRNFIGATAINFGTAPATSFTIVSDSVLTAIVDTGATGAIKITTPRGTASLNGFTYTGLPAIAYFTPGNMASVGSTVTITGANFNPIADSNTVYFGTAKANISNASISTLTVTVPSGTSSLPVSVTTGGLTGYSRLSFRKTFPGGEVGFSDSSFATTLRQTTGSKPTMSCVADFDRDGKPDLAVVHDHYKGDLSIFRNTSVIGTIAFQPRQNYPIGTYLSGVATSDLDGDGKLDLAISSIGSHKLSILKNTSTSGNISFDTPLDIDTEFGASWVSIADVDSDGKPDVAVIIPHPGIVYIYKNTSTPGNISFGTRMSISAPSPQTLTFGNLNLDDKPELIIACATSSGPHIRIHRNISTTGNMSYEAATEMATGVYPSWVAAQDMNGDGKTDLVLVNNEYRTISLFRNQAISPTIYMVAGPQYQVPLPGDLRGLAIEDMDGDAKPDILLSRSLKGAVMLLKNNSSPVVFDFQLTPAYAVAQSPNSVTTGDFDGDGKPDLVTTNPDNGSLSFLRNKVAEATITPSGSNPVTGPITNKVTIESAVSLLNGTPYVQRHYDIEPLQNPATATATLKLYFTQQDFDNFNFHPAHGPDLPRNPTDAAGKANLRIYQYHGFSATGQPGNTGDTVKVIDPVDANIMWDTTANSWQVTFNVEGFSGFLVSSVGFVFAQFPGPLITLSGGATTCAGNSILLTSSAATDNQWFKDGQPINGATGVTYQATATGAYTVTTKKQDISTLPSASQSITVNPIPAKPVITHSNAVLTSSAPTGNQWYFDGVAITGATASAYTPVQNGDYSVKVTTNSCTSEASEKFNFILTGIINIDNTHFISLSPNPVRDQVQLNFQIAGITKLNVQIFDVRGKSCKTLNNTSSGASINLANLPAGMYMAKIYSNTGKQHYTIKLLKQ